MPRFRKQRRLLPLTLLVALAMACSVFARAEKDPDPPSPISPTSTTTQADTEPTPIDCQGASLAKESAKPGELVTLQGLPAGVEPGTAYVSLGPSGEETEIPVLWAEGDWVLMTPIHSDGVGGGELDLTLWVGSTRCGIVALRVEPMEVSNGAFGAYVDALQEYMELTRRLYGVTREELEIGGAEPLPRYLLPLAFAQQLIQGPEVQNNLRALADGTAPIAQEAGYDPALFDAMVVQLGLEEEVAAEIEAIRRVLGETASSGAFRSARPVPQVVIGNITTAAELDQAMRMQDACEGRHEGATGQLLSDAAKSARAVAGGVTKLLPGAWKYVGKAAVGATLLPGLACEFLLPSSFASMSAVGSILWFPDEWAGGPGAVTGTEVIAVGQELNFMEKVEELTDGMEDADRQQELRQLARDLCNQFEDCREDEPVMGPKQYGPIDVTGPEWTEASAVNEVVSVATTGPVFTYSPQEIGVGGVRLRTRADRFGEAAPAQTKLDVRVADCVDTGVKPPEASYQFSLPDHPIVCTTPMGTGEVTAHGGQYTAQLSWSDAYACVIHVDVGPAQYLAARVLATESVSVYQGVILEGETTCGVTMSWDEGAQSFLGELRCWAGVAGQYCEGDTSFSMSP